MGERRPPRHQHQPCAGARAGPLPVAPATRGRCRRAPRGGTKGYLGPTRHTPRARGGPTDRHYNPAFLLVLRYTLPETRVADANIAAEARIAEPALVAAHEEG